MENDEKTNPESEQEVAPSATDQTPAEVSEDEKPPVEAPVPYSRFKEVIEEKNSFKTELEQMKQEIEELKTAKEPEPEPTTYQEVEERAVKKALTQFEKRQMEAEAKDREQEQAIETKFEQLKAIGQNITPEIRKEVLTEMVKTGNTDVVATFLEIKKNLDKTSKAETQKKEGFVPPSGKGSAASKGFSYKELRRQSLEDILAEAS